MKFHYDKKVDALSIRFNDKRYAESDEVREGVVFDYDKKGGIIGIEILNASKVVSPKPKLSHRVVDSASALAWVSRNP